jgi:25S rRNA (uracil2634-N3)-methyltransferase
MSIENNSYVGRKCCEDLYVVPATLDCCVKGCIPCLYKLSPSGDYGENIKLPPNIRPELCFRSSNKIYCGLYNRNQSILTLGDGDFSFTLSLSNEFHRQKSANNGLIVATSHESRDTIIRTYPSSTHIIDSLHKQAAVVLHDVDATNLQNNEIISTRYRRFFDVVIWNFPCVRVERGQDGQISELDANILLLSNFFANIKEYLKDGGEVHITHKTIEPFCWWDICGIASKHDLTLHGTVIFDRYNYPGYINRKVLDKKSFPFNDAVTYIFGVGSSAATLTNSNLILYSSIADKLEPVLRSYQVASAVKKKRVNEGGANEGGRDKPKKGKK